MNYLFRQRQPQGDAEQNSAMGQGSDVRSPASPPPSQSEMRESPAGHLSRFSLSRPNLFSRRSSQRQHSVNGPHSETETERETETNETLESPKTPLFNLRLPGGSPLGFTHLARGRTTTTSSIYSASIQGQQDLRNQGRPDDATSRVSNSQPPFTYPEPAATAPLVPGHGTRNDTRNGPTPSELASEETSNASDGRRRRRARLRRVHGTGRHNSERRPQKQKRFLFCFPWPKSRRMRTVILQCFVSGVFMTLLLSIYLGLQFTSRIQTSEFTILLIMIILFSAIFFCHGLFRLSLLLLRPQSNRDSSQNSPDLYHNNNNNNGYVPNEPIRVVLARDEEEQEDLEAQTTGTGTSNSTSSNKPKPPPYGAWRQSVRVDPDRLFWQRNPDMQGRDDASARCGDTTAGPRPPSYVSDDGVDYVVEARPRSMAPTAMMEAPLPVHPSEAGRVDRLQARW